MSSAALSDSASTPTVEAAVARIRSWRHLNKIPPSRFASEAGVSETVTRDMDTPGWNPTRRNLRKLERLVPEGWKAGDAVPSENAA
jgi:hypothetical protein